MALAFGGTLALLLMGNAGSTTIEVDDSYASDDPAAHLWNTLREGILDAAPGDTVLVHDGTYVDNITIDNASVTITGESRSNVIVRNSTASDPIFRIAANGIVLQNLTLEGGQRGLEAIGANRSNGVIDNVTFANQTADCVLLDGASNWTIHDSSIYGCGNSYGSAGITLSGSGSGGHRLWSLTFNRTGSISLAIRDAAGVQIVRSFFWPTGNYYYVAIVAAGTDSLIEANVCDGFTICVDGSADNLRVANNTFSNTSYAVRASSRNGLELVGNRITNATDAAIMVDAQYYSLVIDPLIAKNTLVGARLYAIRCSGCMGGNITGNLIEDIDENGVIVWPGTIAAWGLVIDRNVVTNASQYCVAGNSYPGLVLRNNTFTGCGYGGLDIRYTTRWLLRDNRFINQSTPLLVSSSGGLAQYDHDIDPSNIANGYPIRYWFGRSNLAFNGSAGLVYAIGCARLNVTVTNQMNLSGVVLVRTTDSTFRNVDIVGGAYGVEVYASDSNVFANMSVNGTAQAFYLSSSSNNRIVGGSFSSYNRSWGDGVTLWGTNNTVEGVSLGEARNCLIMNGDGNRVLNSTFSNCGEGIYVLLSNGFEVRNVTMSAIVDGGINGTYVTNGTIEGATINNVQKGSSIRFQSSSNLLIRGCDLDGARFGIRLLTTSAVRVEENRFANDSLYFLFFSADSSGNLVFHNNFFGTPIRVSDANGGNTYDQGYPVGGNYWSGATLVDRFGGPTQTSSGPDGISDTALTLVGSEQDAYPLVEPWPPSISLVTPANGSLLGPSSVVSFRVAAYFDAATYSINNGSWTNFTVKWNVSMANVSEGNLTIRVRGTDAAFNTSRWFFFVLDATPPVIVSTGPARGSLITAGTILTFKISDPHLAPNATWSIGGAPQNFGPPYEIDTSGWADGAYAVTLQALDTAGNVQVSTFLYYIDSAPPTVDWPAWAGGYYDAGTLLVLHVTDALPAWLSWTVGGSAGGNVSGDSALIDTSGWAEGSHVVQVAAVDIGNHVATATFSVTIDSVSPVFSNVSVLQGERIRRGGFVNFSVTEANPANVSWRLDGGSEGAPAGSGGSHILATESWPEGVHLLTLTATDRAGHLAMLVLSLEIDGTPPALPLLAPTRTDEVGAIVRYDARGATASEGPLPDSAFEWTFQGAGPPTVLVGTLVNWTWPSVGSLEVTLAVYDAVGNVNSTVITVTVVDTTPPRLDLVAPSWVNEGFRVEFRAENLSDNDAANVTGITVEWFFEYGGIARHLLGNVASFTFEVPGRYDLTLTATDRHGNSNVMPFTLRVNDVPSVAALLPTTARLPATYEAVVEIVDTDAGDSHSVSARGAQGLTAIVSGHTFTIRFDPPSAGTFRVNITVSDNWSTYFLEYTIEVSLNTPPWFSEDLGGQLSVAAGAKSTIRLAGLVGDAEDAANLSFEAVSSDPSVLKATIISTPEGPALYLEGLVEGRATLTLRVSDPYGGLTSKEIEVVVPPQHAGLAGASSLLLVTGIMAGAGIAVLLLVRRARSRARR